MKKTVLIAAFIGFLFSSLLLFAKEENYSKKFNVNKNDILKIENKYGDVKIQNWDRDEVEIGVIVRVETSKSEKTEKMLENIVINFEENDNEIVGTTKFSNLFGVSKLFTKGNINIEYTVSAPEYLAIFVDLSHGNISLDNRMGNVNISLSDGIIESEKLTGLNDFKLRGVDFNIKKLGASVFNLKNSTVKIDTVDQVYCKSFDSEFSIVTTDSVELNSFKDKIVFENILSLSGKSNFSNIRVENLKGLLFFKTTFGQLHCENISDGFKKINIDLSKTKTSLEFQENTCYDLLINHHRSADMDIPEDYDLNMKFGENKSNFVTKGHVGSDDCLQENQVIIDIGGGNIRIR